MNNEKRIEDFIGTWGRVLVGIVKILDAGLMVSGKIAITFTSFSKLYRGQQPETQLIDSLDEIGAVTRQEIENERQKYAKISSSITDSIILEL